MKIRFGPESRRDGNIRTRACICPRFAAPVLDEQDYHRADEICHLMQGLFAEAYQLAGNLKIDFVHEGALANYRPRARS